MRNALNKLLDISSDPLGKHLSKDLCPRNWNDLQIELFDVLKRKNGFYSFESALLLRPLKKTNMRLMTIDKWNLEDAWLNTYQLALPDLFFFAEDAFGGQFAISGDVIVSFDPETGKTEAMSDSLEGWASQILADYNVLTGYPLARDWQKHNGPLSAGERLVPKQLFVLGGEFTCENLMAVDEVRGMRSRGFFATELADVPEGGQISFRLVD